MSDAGIGGISPYDFHKLGGSSPGEDDTEPFDQEEDDETDYDA